MPPEDVEQRKLAAIMFTDMVGYSALSQRDEMFENIHSDPRWLPFLRKLGRAPEQLAKIQFKVTLPRQ